MNPQSGKSLVQVVTWLLLSFTCLVLVFRFLTRFFLSNSRKGAAEDVLVILSFVFSLAQSIPILLPGALVLGGETIISSPRHQKEGLRLAYVSGLFLIFSLLFAKLSVCLSILHLTPDERHRRVIWGLSIACILWSISSFLGSAFRCCIDNVWLSDPTTCINESIFQRYIIAGNMLTDAILISVAIWLIFPLNMALKTRLVVVGLFSARLLVIVASVFEFIFTPRTFLDNLFQSARIYLIVRQCVQFASIASACIAYFHPFFQSLRSGLIFSNSSAFPNHTRISHGSSSQKNSGSANRNSIQLEQVNTNDRDLALSELNR